MHKIVSKTCRGNSTITSYLCLGRHHSVRLMAMPAVSSVGRVPIHSWCMACGHNMNERGFPESCQVPPPQLDRRIMSSMLDIMPAPGLIFHEWDQHGTCSGLKPREYFDVVRKARTRVAIPPQYADPTVPLRVTPNQVINAFISVNEGLTPTAITIDCDRTRLREVRICFSRNLKFRECSRGNQRSCHIEKLVMPPVRGG